MGSQQLTFDGDIELIDVGGGGEDGYTIEAVAGTRFGNPVPVEAVVASFLRDGSIISKSGDENREMSILVQVRAPDGVALALGEKRLNLATGRRTTLAWTPPDGLGPTTVFDVLTSSLERVEDDWDLDEVRGVRTYSLRLVCLPFGRSVDLVVDDAGTPPSGGGTLLYNCESTAEWSGGYSPHGGLRVVDAVVFSEGAGSVKSRTQNYNNNTPGVSKSSGVDVVSGLSLSTGSGGYLAISHRFEWDKTFLNIYYSTAAGEVWVQSPIEMARDAQGFVRYVWPVDAGLTITGFRFQWAQSGPVISAVSVNPHYVWYDDFRLLPAATTDHQILKQLVVAGSARTTGSLRVSAPTDSVALGKVLAVTAPAAELPSGFMPDGRRWVSQGTTTTDSTALWGSYFTPHATAYDSGAGKPIFDVPVGMFTPGPYTIVALVKAEGSPTVAGVQAQLRYGSTDVGPVSAAEVSVPNLAGGWHFVPVGTVNLPPLPMQSADTTAKVRLLFKGAKLADVYMIPAWQVGGSPVAEFSIVDCGTGTVSASGASSNLWLDSPSVLQPRGGLWRGPASDRTNTRSAWPDAKKTGVHVFSPGTLTAFLVSLGAQGPTLELSYHPAWFGNAAS